MASHPALGAEERIGETERLGGSDAEEIEICVMVCAPPETPLGRAGAKLQNRNIPGRLRFFASRSHVSSTAPRATRPRHSHLNCLARHKQIGYALNHFPASGDPLRPKVSQPQQEEEVAL